MIREYKEAGAGLLERGSPVHDLIHNYMPQFTFASVCVIMFSFFDVWSIKQQSLFQTKKNYRSMVFYKKEELEIIKRASIVKNI